MTSSKLRLRFRGVRLLAQEKAPLRARVKEWLVFCVEATDRRPRGPVVVCGTGQMMLESYRFRKDVRDWPFRCRENHPSQKACSGSGLGFVHDPFEMLFDGVFA